MSLSPDQRARMAERLRRGRTGAASGGAPPGSPAGAAVVELAPSDAGEALFLVHAIAGTVHGYLPLARALAGTYRSFGIAVSGAAELAPAGSVRELGERYLELVRDRQSSGPYALGGWSTGGLVAYEMARLLEEQGEPVARLVLVDTPFHTPVDVPSQEELAAEFVRDAARSGGLHVGAVPEYGAGGVEQQLDWLASRLGGPQAGGVLREELQRRFAAFRTNRLLIVGHLPQGSIGADTVLVWASDSPNRLHKPGWPSVLRGNVTAVTVSCDHYALLAPPAVDEVAAAVAGLS
jgi:thioesterase domain-containing protein